MSRPASVLALAGMRCLVGVIALAPAIPDAAPSPSSPAAASASSAPESSSIDIGRALYHGERALRVAPRLGAASMPADAGCAGCHGADGRGNREGGVRVPALRSAAASSFATDDAPQRHAAAMRLVQSATDGRSVEGRELRSPMPRYSFTGIERVSLAEYLAVLGTEREPVRGVDPRTLRLGTLLPSSGPRRAIGDAIHAGLQDRFDGINRSGGLFGRRIELIRIDASPLERIDDPERATLWLRETLSRAPILALVGSFGPDASLVGGAQWKALRLPSIGMLSAGVRESPREPSAAGWSSRLMPSVQVQARAAKAALDGGCPVPGATLEVMHAATPGLHDALADALDTPGIRFPESAQARPAPGEPRRVLVVDGPGALQAVRAGLGPRDCLSSLAMFSGARPLSSTSATPRELLVLPAPPALPIDTTAPAALWSALARLSASLAIEVLSRSGRLLQPESVAAAQDTMPAFEPVPGVVLELTRERRHALPVSTAWRQDGRTP